jgi:Ni,Fe-hydrogenase III small subunit
MSKLEDRVKKIGRSIWVFHVNSGGCNGCDIEVIDTLTPYFDVERFGIRRVPSPRQADILLVTGPVTRQSLKPLLRAYRASPNPKVVVALGSCGCGGGIWHDSFATMGGVDKVLPVDVYVPGCPPKPEAIIHGLLVAVGKMNQKISRKVYVQGAE